VALLISAKPANIPVGSGSEVLQENHPTSTLVRNPQKINKRLLDELETGGYYTEYADLPCKNKKW